jgi:hypothetical protein
MVETRPRATAPRGNSRVSWDFSRSSHEFGPTNTLRWRKTSLATALKYSVTINACLIAGRLKQTLVNRGFRDASENAFLVPVTVRHAHATDAVRGRRRLRPVQRKSRMLRPLL